MGVKGRAENQGLTLNGNLRMKGLVLEAGAERTSASTIHFWQN